MGLAGCYFLTCYCFFRARVVRRGFGVCARGLLFEGQVAREDRASAFEERSQGLRVERRDGEAFARADLACLAEDGFEFVRREEVCFVEDDEARDARVPKLAEDALDGFELLVPAWVRGVNEMDEKVAVINLFERGAEGGDEVGRQVAYEAHGVVDDDLLLARQPEAARGRVERGEHALLGEHLG